MEVGKMMLRTGFSTSIAAESGGVGELSQVLPLTQASGITSEYIKDSAQQEPVQDHIFSSTCLPMFKYHLVLVQVTIADLDLPTILVMLLFSRLPPTSRSPSKPPDPMPSATLIPSPTTPESIFTSETFFSLKQPLIAKFILFI